MARRQYDYPPGHRFDRLEIVKEYGKDKWGAILYQCRCDCGTVKNIPSYDLRRPNRKSCGTCLVKRRSPLRYERHGGTKRPEYSAWANMIQRCTNRRLPSWKNYGGRGIKVCYEWLHSFELFYADMGARPSDEHSLDRKDVNGNYDRKNCRWATREEQMMNRCNSVWVTVAGVSKTLKQIADETGKPMSTIYKRYQLGWSGDQIYG